MYERNISNDHYRGPDCDSKRLKEIAKQITWGTPEYYKIQRLIQEAIYREALEEALRL